MNLTLEALKKGKQKCVDIAGLESVMSVNERTEIQMALTDLSKSFDQCINVVAKIEEVKGSLEKFGYTDEWYDTVFMMSGIENLVEFDIPKLTTYGTKQEACMEGFVDTVWEWIKKAWNFIKSALDKLYRFIMWAAKQLGLNTQKKFDRLENAVKMMKAAKEFSEDKFREAAGVDIETFYDDAPIKAQIEGITKLIDAVTDPSLKDEIITYADKQEGFMTADRVRTMFADLLKGRLDSMQVNYSKAEESGFVLKFNAAINKMVYYFGKQTGKQFPQTKLAIDELTDLEATLQRVRDLNSDKVKMTGKYTNWQNKLTATVQTDKLAVDAANNATTPDQKAFYKPSPCHARLIVTTLMLDIVAGGVSYLAEVDAVVSADITMCEKLVAIITAAMKQNATQPTQP